MNFKSFSVMVHHGRCFICCLSCLYVTVSLFTLFDFLFRQNREDNRESEHWTQQIWNQLGLLSCRYRSSLVRRSWTSKETHFHHLSTMFNYPFDFWECFAFLPCIDFASAVLCLCLSMWLLPRAFIGCVLSAIPNNFLLLYRAAHAMHHTAGGTEWPQAFIINV